MLGKKSSWGRAALAAGAVAVVLSTGVGTAGARPIGPFEVGGAIEVAYDRSGGPGVFGDPVGPELDAAGGGKKQDFANNISIYWTPATDAHAVGGAIREKWTALGSESGTLKYPTADEGATAKPGRFQTFQGGAVYWSLGTAAHALTGVILQKYGQVGWENSPLGFPITDVAKTTTDNGLYGLFEGGAIYSTQKSGTHVIWGSIRDEWVRNGAENGRYGFPTSDEYDYNGGKAQDFQGGKITWSP
ncbi:LGFP repeat-containing protein [Nocardia sp. IFM 10818]